MKSLLPILVLLTFLPLFNGCKHSAVLIVKGYRIEEPSSMTSNLDVWFCKSDADKILVHGRNLTEDSLFAEL